MSFRATALKRSLLLTFFFGLLLMRAFPQAKDSPLVFNSSDGVTSTLVDAPSALNIATATVDPDSKWLKVEFHYGIKLKPGEGDYLPSATFKVWIEGVDPLAPNPTQPTGKGVAVAFTGTVTYINIHQGSDCYGVFFVHPSTLGRYCANSPTDFESKFNVHVQATIGYAEADYFDERKEKDLNWYKALKPLSGLVYRQDQCAFISADPTRYPAIAPASSGTSESDAGATPPPAAPAPAPAP